MSSIRVSFGLVRSFLAACPQRFEPNAISKALMVGCQQRRWFGTEPAKSEKPKKPKANTSLKCKKRLLFGLASCHCDLMAAKLWFFWGNDFKNHKQFNLTQARDIIGHAEFRPERQTVIYVHGYVETMDDESQQTIVAAYQKRDDHNLIVLDWSALADGSYLFDACQNAKEVAGAMTGVVMDMCGVGTCEGGVCKVKEVGGGKGENLIPLEKVHLVGHSLGGQICGLIGRFVRGRTCGTQLLTRISALDPAFPGFYPGKHISASDAHLVDVIHTDAWLYGAPISTGSIDFWPNSGKTLQPGCPKRDYKRLSDIDLCSHQRSWRYWAESVANGQVSQNNSKMKSDTFAAVKADSWQAFVNGQMDWKVVNMGIDCVPGSTGNFYLQTNAAAPFNRRMNGIMFDRKAWPSSVRSDPCDPKPWMNNDVSKTGANKRVPSV